jgi:hypothetical protein
MFTLRHINAKMAQQIPLAALNEYEAAIEKGKTLFRGLENFQTTQPSSLTLSSCGYAIESTRLRPNAESAVQMLVRPSGLLINRLSFVDVRSAGTIEHDDVAYSNWTDARHGIIVCNENYKVRDSHPDERRMWPSDVLFESWSRMNAQDGFSASDLRAVVRLRMVNDTTKNVAWVASVKSSASRIEEFNYVEYTPLDNGFWAMLGTPNGASTIRMLRDHKRDLKFRLVEKIVVLGDEALSMTKPETRHMVIFLSGPRSPPPPPSRIPRPIRPASERRFTGLARS